MKKPAEQPRQFSKSRITIDPVLDELYAGKVLFPEKHAFAQEMIKKHGLPPLK